MRRVLLAALVAGIGLLLILSTAPPAHAASKASCYGDTTDGFLGGTTADGTTVRSNTIGLAHKTLPFSTVLMVKVDGRRPVRARVMDRGPYSGDRVLDVTWGLAKVAGFRDCSAWGVRKVRTWRAR